MPLTVYHTGKVITELAGSAFYSALSAIRGIVFCIDIPVSAVGETAAADAFHIRGRVRVTGKVTHSAVP
jgi:hypothetical protein